MEEALSCFLYRSYIAPDQDISCVADIVKTSRRFNKEQHITGILVFDGERFCQYIEGPRAPLQALIQRLEKDPRHVQFTPKHEALLQGARMFASWSMAYVLVDDTASLEEMEPLNGLLALGKLKELIPMLDNG